MIPQHLQRYVHESACRRNIRRLDAKERMVSIDFGLTGTRLRWQDLTSNEKKGVPAG